MMENDPSKYIEIQSVLLWVEEECMKEVWVEIIHYLFKSSACIFSEEDWYSSFPFSHTRITPNLYKAEFKKAGLDKSNASLKMPEETCLKMKL